MSEELKPCPFCGDSAIPLRNRYFWVVFCHRCEAEGPPSEHEDEAITKWNCRAEAAPIVPVAHVSEVHMSRYTIEWTNGPLAQGAPLYAAPIVPQGWKLVPVGPTPEMVRAGQELKPLGKWHAQIKAVWTAMLAASPAPDNGMRAAMVKLSKALGHPSTVEAGEHQCVEAALIELAAQKLNPSPAPDADGVPAQCPTCDYQLRFDGTCINDCPSGVSVAPKTSDGEPQ